MKTIKINPGFLDTNEYPGDNSTNTSLISVISVSSCSKHKWPDWKTTDPNG